VPELNSKFLLQGFLTRRREGAKIFKGSLRLCVLALNFFWLAACAGPGPVSVTATASPAPTNIPHADAIHFALVGRPVDVNVWSLFDETGASYANYALHSDEYPRLYRLSIPEREFEPYVAESLPSVVTQAGEFFTATASLQRGLTWSDGSPLSAQDAAFTINTALAFRLSYDWLSAYNPVLLDRAEAADDATLKFYFNQPFNVGDWQYGALQGAIVNRAYWSPKVAEASARLPSQDLTASLETVQAEADLLQTRVDADNAQLLNTLPNSETYTELSRRVVRNQNELNSLNSRLAGLQDEYDAALNAARTALFALEDEGEPTFGPFLRVVQNGGVFTRNVNPSYPFEKPNFDRAAYSVFEELSSAMEAFTQGEADVVLSSGGAFQDPSAPSYPVNSGRFLVFNRRHPVPADPALRRAISCMMDTGAIVSGQERAYDGFISTGPWLEQEPRSICFDLSREARILNAVQALKAAGYSWAREPTVEQAGSGLVLPNGEPFPALVFLTTPPDYELWRANAAIYVGLQLQSLGIPYSAQELDPESLRYRAYSSGDYDMTILGWSLAEYPGYLCDWFREPGLFAYGSSRLTSACEGLNSTADLGTARQAMNEIHSVLMEDLPFIPLYQTQRYEAYRNVMYPFEGVTNGLSGLYGAPALAIPAP
jgi:peptide/nickel transport system substrate-binding protein